MHITPLEFEEDVPGGRDPAEPSNLKTYHGQAPRICTMRLEVFYGARAKDAAGAYHPATPLDRMMKRVSGMAWKEDGRERSHAPHEPH